MTELVRINVIGLPAPQGSKTRMPNGAMVEAGSKTGRERHGNWRAAVADAARDHAQLRGHPIREPVSLTIVFRFPPVKSNPHRHRHTTKPDLDKLQRATIDSLVHAQLLADDSLIWHIDAYKTYAANGHPAGAEIHVALDGAHEDAHQADAKARARAARRGAA